MDDIDGLLDLLRNHLERDSKNSLERPSELSYQMVLHLYDAIRKNNDLVNFEVNKRNLEGNNATRYRGIVELENGNIKGIEQRDSSNITSLHFTIDGPPPSLERYSSVISDDGLVSSHQRYSSVISIEGGGLSSGSLTNDDPPPNPPENLHSYSSFLSEGNVEDAPGGPKNLQAYNSFVSESNNDYDDMLPPNTKLIKMDSDVTNDEYDHPELVKYNSFIRDNALEYDSVFSTPPSFSEPVNNEEVTNPIVHLANKKSTSAKNIHIYKAAVPESESGEKGKHTLKKTDNELIKSFSSLNYLCDKVDGVDDDSVIGVTEWNTRFLRCKSLPESNDEERLAKATLITELLVDFNHISGMFGKIIISEIFLPDHKKTIKRKTLGGLAGGDKFIVGGIFFKLAVDDNDPERAIYQGDDELAAKAASHDLKGLTNIYETIKNVNNVCVPLQSLIDYRGFRLIAMSILPLNKEITKVPLMGTSNAGITCHADDETLMEIVRKCSETLNLRAHIVGNKKVYFGCDVEGHKGSDDVYYMLDFARVFPPEHPICTSHLPKVKDHRSIFYRMLRPEFVRSYAKKLSPDACSTFGMKDPEFDSHMKDLRDATNELIHKIIPAYCEDLIERGNSGNYSFSKNLHKYGINIRHIGLVRHHVLQKNAVDLQDTLLVEIISRVLKNMLRNEYRKLLKRTKDVAENSFIVTTINFLNLVSGSRGGTFWSRLVPQETKKRYGEVALAEKEKANLFAHVSPSLYDIFISTFSMLCLQLTKISLKQLKKSPIGFKFVTADIESILPRVKTMHLMGESHGTMLSLQASKIISEWESLYDSSIAKSDSPKTALFTKSKSFDMLDFNATSRINSTPIETNFDPMCMSSSSELSEDCTIFTSLGVSDYCLGSTGVSEGKVLWEFELTKDMHGNESACFGAAVKPMTAFLTSSSFYSHPDVWFYRSLGDLYSRGERLQTKLLPIHPSDIISVVYDANEGTLSYSRNGRDQGIAFTNVGRDAGGKRIPVYPAVCCYSAYEIRIKFVKMEIIGSESSEYTESLAQLSAGSRESERLLTLSDEYLSSAYTSFPADMDLLVTRAKDLIRLALLPHIGAAKRTNLLESSAAVFKTLPLYKSVVYAIRNFHRRLQLKQISFSSSITTAIKLQKAENASQIVTILNLVSCTSVINQKLDFAHIEKFFKALKYNGSLDALSLAGNALTKGGGFFCTTVQVLSDALKVNTILVYLDVSNCKLSSNGATTLAGGLMGNNTLAYLNVSKNLISGDGGVSLGFVLKSNKGLRCVDISENNLGDEGMKSFSDSLATNSTLIYLNLAKNMIFGYSATELATSLKENCTLTYLDLLGNDIGDKGADSINLLFNKSDTLINIKGWKSINQDLSFEEIVDENIEFVNEKSFDKVQHRGIKSLGKHTDRIFISNLGVVEGKASWDLYLNTANVWVGILGEELDYSKQFWLYNYTTGIVRTHSGEHADAPKLDFSDADKADSDPPILRFKLDLEASALSLYLNGKLFYENIFSNLPRKLVYFPAVQFSGEFQHVSILYMKVEYSHSLKLAEEARKAWRVKQQLLDSIALSGNTFSKEEVHWNDLPVAFDLKRSLGVTLSLNGKLVTSNKEGKSFAYIQYGISSGRASVTFQLVKDNVAGLKTATGSTTETNNEMTCFGFTRFPITDPSYDKGNYYCYRIYNGAVYCLGEQTHCEKPIRKTKLGDYFNFKIDMNALTISLYINGELVKPPSAFKLTTNEHPLFPVILFYGEDRTGRIISFKVENKDSICDVNKFIQVIEEEKLAQQKKFEDMFASYTLLKNHSFDKSKMKPNLTLSEDGNTIGTLPENIPGVVNNTLTMLDLPLTNGKCLIIFTITQDNLDNEMICFGATKWPLPNGLVEDYETSSHMYFYRCYNGNLYHNGLQPPILDYKPPKVHMKDLVTMLIDLDEKKISYKVNDGPMFVAFTDVSGVLYPAVYFYGINRSARIESVRVSFPVFALPPAKNLTVVTVGSTSCDIKWEYAPPQNGGAIQLPSKIILYISKVEGDSDLNSNFQQHGQKIGGHLNSFKITGLKSETRYKGKIVLENYGGLSEESTELDFQTTINTIPSCPTIMPIELESVSSTSISIKWIPPEDNGGLLISKYSIYISQGAVLSYNVLHDSPRVLSVPTNEKELPFLFVDKLNPNSEYTFGVTAWNAVGEGPLARIIHTTKSDVEPYVDLIERFSSIFPHKARITVEAAKSALLDSTNNVEEALMKLINSLDSEKKEEFGAFLTYNDKVDEVKGTILSFIGTIEGIDDEKILKALNDFEGNVSSTVEFLINNMFN